MALQPASSAASASRPIILRRSDAVVAWKEGMSMTAVDVVVMAAGKGTRMKSRLPKVLHRLAGRALLQHVVACVARLQVRRVVIVTGNGADQVEAAVAGWRYDGLPAPVFVRQEPQLGTGHAV